ncbi:MAG: Holliday junction branch migration protein RuvA [Chloroflexi bacterium]|nr:Holliday junction branch migration protein RuvA [Chloroflexota bacterium]
MIASINGRIAEIDADSIVLEVGGIGLRVYVPAPLRDELQPGKSAALHTHLIVRENDLTLYGFETKEEREFFSMLLGVNGVGPRLALAILSTLTPNAIRRAVFNEQAEIFSSVSGVGKKTAQKIALHLEDRLPASDSLEAVAIMDDTDSEVLAALTALGYSIIEAQAALQIIPEDAPDGVEERLRLALQYFSKP